MAKYRRRVPASKPYEFAGHDPSLRYEVEVEDGRLITQFLVHPKGNRKVRRYFKSKHTPMYHKKRTKGRDWLRFLREEQQEAQRQRDKKRKD